MTDINHPVGYLTHTQACCMTQLLLLVLAWIRVVRVTMQPGLEVVSRLLGKFSPFALRAIDKLR